MLFAKLIALFLVAETCALVSPMRGRRVCLSCVPISIPSASIVSRHRIASTRVMPHAATTSEGDSGAEPMGVVGKVQAFIKTRLTKKSFAAAGLAVFLSYGFVSNISSCTMLAWTWAKYVKDTGQSPYSGPRPPFLTKKFFAYYGAVYITIGSLLRPVRAAIAGAISPVFNNAIDYLQTKLHFPKPLAILSLVLACNVIFTFAWLFLNLKIAFLVLRVTPGVAPVLS
mmetsp:Transcript_85630/g.165916  ORF Transcript_85630/g.165916 Transcript_85630/m.165916 type:complete len:227 (-) Transcript_85630:197-877(-)